MDKIIHLLKKESIWQLLLGLYIIFFSVKILDLPLTKNKLQPGDLIFLVISATTLFHLKKIRFWQLNRIDYAVLFWLIAHLITCLFHPTSASIFELIGTLYLSCLYFIINLLWQNNSVKDIEQFFCKYINISVALISTIGLIIYVLALAGFPTSFVLFLHDYPYFGDLYRLQVWTRQPIMLSSILSVFILFLIPFKNNNYLNKWILVIALVALILTFSKSTAIFVACFSSFILFSKFKTYLLKSTIIIASAFCIYLFATHYVIINKSEFKQGHFFFFLDKTPSADLGESYLLKTGYLMLKERSAYAFINNPIVGIGSGNLTKYKEYYPNENYKIISTDYYDPHSSITGILSEMGIIGFAAFVFLYFSLFKTILSYKISNNSVTNLEFKLKAALLLILIYMLSEAFCADVMNFRHYWIIFAFISVFYRNKIQVNQTVFPNLQQS
jgi:hypothetical protein